MSGSKHLDKIAWTVTALILVITILFMNGGALGIEAMAYTMRYENRLFDNTKVHKIDIVMDDWDEFISNAVNEEYHTASMVIDGEAYKNIAIRGKGNTSLSTVSSMDSDRYSFKVEFDHYDSSTTYHGLDKLSLNNLIQDSTMMKDYLTYTMMNEFGAAAPLCSFAYITVNGDDWGLYLAVEGVEESFLKRNYGSGYGELYKPDSMSFGGGRGNGKDFNMESFMNDMEADGGITVPQIPETDNFTPSRQGESFGGGKGGFGGMGSSDVKLQYIDDNADSYSNIWNNAKTDITEADKTRLIEALKKLSAREEIESVVDVEQVIRYFVVHNYVCNGDSYTGSMIHNYYLYEENGRMEMIPWDYNLAFGTFQGGNAQSTVNTPVDAPVSGGAGEDRPMWNWILSDEAYTELYHQYFAEFLDKIDIDGIIDNAYELIKAYVEKDPTSFYTYEEFETGIKALRKFCSLRSESILMQLANDETTSDMGYVDASELVLSDMGSMGMGGGMPDMGGNIGGFGGRGGFDGAMTTTPEEETVVSSAFTVQRISSMTAEGMPQNGQIPEMPEGFDPSQMQGGTGGQMPNMGEMPEGFDPSQIPGGFGGGFPGQSPNGAGTIPSDGTDSSEESNDAFSNNMQMPSGEFGFNMDGTAQSNTGWIWLGVSVLILGIGLVIAKLYRY